MKNSLAFFLVALLLLVVFIVGSVALIAKSTVAPPDWTVTLTATINGFSS